MTEQKKVETSEAAPIHENVYAAIAAAKGDVKRLVKGERNKDQGYNFASIDDFLELVGPITARHGLVPIVDETDCEFIEKPGKYNPTMWVRLRYSIVMCHASGQMTPPVTRNLEVLRTGPQAYGSAQSYVLKQYYRGLLEIPTGDADDPDFTGGRREDADLAPRNTGPDPQAVSIAVTSLENAASLDALRDIWTGLPRDVQHSPNAIKAKNDRKAALEENKAPPREPINDEVPEFT